MDPRLPDQPVLRARPRRGRGPCRLLDDAADLWQRQASPGGAGGLADLNFRAGTFGDRDDQAEEFPSSLRASTESIEPSLDFIHVLFPHYGFDYLPAGQELQRPPFPMGSAFGGWYDDDIAAAGPASATCCSCSTPTGCSAASSTG